jgi:NAD(P)-dependent dehydrogenase (short-subunit alcohol dehydrogenase family)
MSFNAFLSRPTCAVVIIVFVLLTHMGVGTVFAQGVEPPSVLITGSNRGIGLEFVKQYAAKGWFVIATTRKPMQAQRLGEIAHANENVVIERLDVTNGTHIAALAAKYEGRPIDLLINNAGVSGDFMGPSQAFGSLDYEQMDNFMSVNAIAPLRVTEALYENVRMSDQKKVVAITALLGVHSFNYGGFSGAYWYKVSKAALNAAMANLAREAAEDGVIVTLLTPGEVKVEKVGDNPGPRFIEPAVSIKGMIKVIDGLTPNDAGAIIRYNGRRYEF